jgi:hydrogenase maturation protease
MNRILVAGIGNIFMGDDGFGCEVARQLSCLDLPADVDVVDFGIRGIDLGYALMDGYEVAILLDAIARDGAPGTVHVIEPELDEAPLDLAEQAEEAEPLIALHEMDPLKVLRFVAALGKQRPRVLLVACEPESLGGEEGFMGLSVPVAAAVGRAVNEVRVILDALQCGATANHQKLSAQPSGAT